SRAPPPGAPPASPFTLDDPLLEPHWALATLVPTAIAPSATSRSHLCMTAHVVPSRRREQAAAGATRGFFRAERDARLHCELGWARETREEHGRASILSGRAAPPRARER